ncbi:MAG: hypothetical protein JW743_07275 [Deltaproteobacteria bacterium]|nr:hypothetical protein [Deltaproteobacteria bacterium]
MRKTTFLLCIVSILSLTLLFQNAYGAAYMKQKEHIDAVKIMGTMQPAHDLIVESWITPTKMAIMNEKQKTVIDLDKKTITTANHEEKTIVSMPMDFSKKMNKEIGEMSQEEKDSFEQVMNKMMQMNVKVEETKERKKIGKWNCRKYIQTIEMAMGTTNSEIWATEEIKVDGELYAKHSTGMMAQMPGMSQNIDAIMQEIKKIKGVHVYSEQTTVMMGQTMKSSVELIEFKEVKAPSNIFDLPAGYKKVEAFQ